MGNQNVEQEHEDCPAAKPDGSSDEPLHLPGFIDQFQEGQGDHHTGSNAHQETKLASTRFADDSQQAAQCGSHPGGQA
jgi:hypothetical protein